MAEDPVARAARNRDERLVGGGLVITDKPAALLVWLKTVLQRVAEGSAADHLRLSVDDDLHVLQCGERKTNWLVLRNSLRCHFEMKVKQEAGGGWRVVAYSFQVDAPDGASAIPPYLRYDLTSVPHPNPIKEPWCHFTPGNDDIRAPAAPMTPKELVEWCMHLAPWWWEVLEVP